MLGVKLQAFVYDILPSRNAPESGAQSVGSPPPHPTPPPAFNRESVFSADLRHYTLCADTLTVLVQPWGAVAGINVCAHVKNAKQRQP